MILVAALLAVLAPLTVATVARPAPAPVPVVAAVPGWDWPLAGRPAVVRAFDPPAAPWLSGHRGVDLAGNPGDPVFAAGAGVVAFAGMVAGRGVVSVDHPGGLRTTYEPVTATVHIGAEVRPGSPLGALDAGHPGCSVAACLHWGLRRGVTYLNPLLLLRPLRARLKPLTSSVVGRSGVGPGHRAARLVCSPGGSVETTADALVRAQPHPDLRIEWAVQVHCGRETRSCPQGAYRGYPQISDPACESGWGGPAWAA